MRTMTISIVHHRQRPPGDVQFAQYLSITLLVILQAAVNQLRNCEIKFYPRKYQRKSKFNKKKTEEEKESAKPLDYDSLIEEIKGMTI